MLFESRQDAGQKLGLYLMGREVRAELVLGLPRGGVIVAAEVARALNLPLDVLIVRKIGHPLQREFAVGALAEGEVVLLDDRSVGFNPIVRHELEEIIREESDRLRAYQARFHPSGPLDIAGKMVVLVDDGLATGATTEAAVRAAKKRHARRVTVAVPVASTSAFTRLSGVADDVLAIHVDPDFDAVGRYYGVFPQASDEEVLWALKAA